MNNTAADLTAPAYIERDTYEGRWQLAKSNATLAESGQCVGVDTAANLARRHGGPGKLFTMWEYVGHLQRNGVHLFHRSRFIANADGSLNVYDQAGRLVLCHPADRDVRYLGGRA